MHVSILSWHLGRTNFNFERWIFYFAFYLIASIIILNLFYNALLVLMLKVSVVIPCFHWSRIITMAPYHAIAILTAQNPSLVRSSVDSVYVNHT